MLTKYENVKTYYNQGEESCSGIVLGGTRWSKEMVEQKKFQFKSEIG